MSAPKLVVWDIGAVLLDWSPDHLYRRLIPDDAARADFYARADVDAMNLAGDRDGDLKAKVEALADRRPEDAALILPWWAGWEKMCAGLIDGAVAARDRLRAAGVATWALSNFAADSWERAVRLHPPLAAFDGIVLSGREGVVKPEAGIYEILEARAGASGGEVFFIDDRPRNVEAAAARGWRGHVFEWVEGMEAALAEAGLRG